MMFDLELLLALDDELELGRELKLESGESGDRGAGGGSIGLARPSRMAFFSAATSCRKALFSDWVLPSSDRIASISRSRSAMSPSSVAMYSAKTKCVSFTVTNFPFSERKSDTKDVRDGVSSDEVMER